MHPDTSPRAVFQETVELAPRLITTDGVVGEESFGQLGARRLDHRIEAFGYQLVEPVGAVNASAERACSMPRTTPPATPA